MKKKSLKPRLAYFFGQRIHKDSSGNMPELIKPVSELQRVESGIEDLLRWADDGGSLLDLDSRPDRLGPDEDVFVVR